jgi:hypothetical protein
MGELELALASFETALDLARKESFPDLARFEDRIEHVRKRMDPPKQ